MAIHFFEGFRTCGTELGLANQATTRPRIEKRFNASSAGGTPVEDSFFLIEDELGDGFACCMGISSFSGNNFLQWNLPEDKQVAPGPSSPTWIVGQRVHVPTTSRTFAILRVQGEVGVDPDATAIEIRIENSENLVVLRGDALTEIARQDEVFSLGDWVYVESKFRIGDSGDGILEVTVDNTVQLNPSPIDTNPALTVAANAFQFRTSAGSATAGDFVAYTDIYAQEGGSYLGASTRVTRIALSSDVLPTQWSPSAPSVDHYTLVDENGADASDYIQAKEDGFTDLFEHSGLPGGGFVHCVKLEAEAISLTSQNGLDVKLNSGGTDAETNHLVDNTSGSEVFAHYSETDPDTGSAWTNEAVDAITAGVQINHP